MRVQQYLDALKNNKSGAHAHLVGQEVILGRVTDVIEISPVVEESAGPCSNGQQCQQTSKPMFGPSGV